MLYINDLSSLSACSGDVVLTCLILTSGPSHSLFFPTGMTVPKYSLRFLSHAIQVSTWMPSAKGVCPHPTPPHSLPSPHSSSGSALIHMPKITAPWFSVFLPIVFLQSTFTTWHVAYVFVYFISAPITSIMQCQGDWGFVLFICVSSNKKLVFLYAKHGGNKQVLNNSRPQRAYNQVSFSLFRS